MIDVAPDRHPLHEVSEVRCKVRGPVVEDEPRDIKSFWKRESPDLLKEGRCIESLYVIGIEPISGKADNFHILSDCLFDLSVKPFPQIVVILWPLAQLLRIFIQMTAA